MSFPELNPLIRDLTLPTSLRFLTANPTPESIKRNGRLRFLDKWRPRRRCGQWRAEKFKTIYAAAKNTVGLNDPHRIHEFEIKALTHDLADAVEKAQMWRDKAIELLEHRDDFQLLLTLPRIGKPTAAAILTAIGDINEFDNAKQLVKLAGLDIRRYESGSSIRKRPKISHVGSGFLRHWLYSYALRLIAFEPGFIALYQRRRKQSPGKAAGMRALMAVNDKILRVVFRMLKDHHRYAPQIDIATTAFYEAQKRPPEDSRARYRCGR